MSQSPKPTLVVVSGPPGSGKTTLAHELARAIPCPAICRDELKEGMAHAHGSDFQGAPGDPLTQRTFPLFFDALTMLVAAGVTVVAEAAFQDSRWRLVLEPLAERAELRIVRCKVAAPVAHARAAGRAGHARVHGVGTTGSFEHITLPAPTLDVDTTDGYDPGLDELLRFVNSR